MNTYKIFFPYRYIFLQFSSTDMLKMIIENIKRMTALLYSDRLLSVNKLLYNFCTFESNVVS